MKIQEGRDKKWEKKILNLRGKVGNIAHMGVQTIPEQRNKLIFEFQIKSFSQKCAKNDIQAKED